jgi:hypothetical protein
MQITQSWAYGNPASGDGAGAGYRNDPVTLLVAASNDANPSPYNVVGNDAFIEVDASSQNVQLILQNAAQCRGQRKFIKRIDATFASGNSVSIIDISGATVEGATSLTLSAQNAVVELQSNGTNWVVKSGKNGAPFGSENAIAAVTVTASPFAYTAQASGTLSIEGGTVSAVTLKRGTPAAVTVAAASGVLVPVAAGDIVTTTYSVLPTMNFIPS